MEKIYYKGRGEHSVNTLEKIIEQLEEELHQIRSSKSKEDNQSLMEEIEKLKEEKSHIIKQFQLLCEIIITDKHPNNLKNN